LSHYLTVLIKITMETFWKTLWLTVSLLLAAIAGSAQPLLQNYIDEGLRNNIVVQQKALSLKQAENALTIARNQFLPSINLMGDYTSGDGGRSIALPVGDLLNPVYQSLNQLTQSDAFPQIQNVEENFFPKDFYDAKVRTTLPIINSDLIINRSIKSKQLLLADYELKAYKRQLTFNISEAYFKILSASEAVKIYEGALKMVAKNVEINESLKRNGKGLPAQVLRSKSELERVKAELNGAQNNFSNARKYFNFLLNRDLSSAVDLDFSDIVKSEIDSVSLEIRGREEVAMARIGNEINQSLVRMIQMKRLPKVNAFLDLGSQASNWQFNDQSQYYLFGVQLAVPLFQGLTNRLSINQSKLDLQSSTLAFQNTSRSFMLAAEIAFSDLQNAKATYRAAQEQLKSAQSYFNLVEHGYAEGLNSLIEFLDARNQLTTSQLLTNVRQFELLIAQKKLERETATTEIN
jgi:outer membrane protein